MDTQATHTVERSRIGYIDIYRAIGIMLMVIGHTAISLTTMTYIMSFHMPMFFFISGFLFRGNRPWKPYIIKKFRTLVVPYLSFGIIAITIVYFGKPSVFPQKLSAFLVYSTEEYPLATAMWFLAALFVSNVVYFVIDRVNNNIIKTLVIVVLAVFGEVFTHLTNIVLPYAIGPALVGVGLMHIGRLMRPYEQQLVSLKSYVVIYLAILGAALSLIEGCVSMRSGTYPNIILFWVVAVINIVVMLNVASFLDKRLKQGPIWQYLVKLGQNAIVYVMFNQQCIKAAEVVANRLKPTIIQQPVCFLLAMILLYCCTEFVTRTKLRWFIGKD